MKPAQGFSLIEMSIVLLIIGLLTSGLLGPLSVQVEASRAKDTQNQLNNIQEALYGFLIANGRLPCPATVASGGNEDIAAAATGQCTAPNTGFIPGRQLGLAPLDGNGFVQDAWGAPIRYAVTQVFDAGNTHYVATYQDGIKSMGLSTFGALSGPPFLYVCAGAAGITATTCGAVPANRLANDAVAILYSTGPNTGSTATGTDEAANPNASSANNDAVFVAHSRTEAAAIGGYFDDIVVWMPRSLLLSKLLAAGRLP